MFDSSANLIFKIAADASSAQTELKQFRGVLKKDLDGVRTDVDGLSTKLGGGLGNLTTLLKGALVGLASVAAAAGSALVATAQKAADYAGEIGSASDKTGIAVEDLSKMRYSAETAGVNFNLLTNSLVIFTAAITDSLRGVKDKQEAFEDLGISMKDVQDGQRNMLPLIEKVSDAFEAQESTVVRTAAARRLFGRSGAEMVEWLSRGSDSMRIFNAEAERLGLVLTNDNIVAAKEFGLEMQHLQARWDAFTLQIGTRAIPALSALAVIMEGFFKTITEEGSGIFIADYIVNVMKATHEAERRIQAALTEPGALGPPEASTPAKKAKTEAKEALVEFTGLSQLLRQVQSELVAFGTEEEQINYNAIEAARQVTEATQRLRELHAEGKISAADFRRELLALTELPGKISELTQQQLAAVAQVRAKAAAELETAEREERERIEAERAAAFLSELQMLQREQEAILFWRMTTQERINYIYWQDLARYSEVEEAKTLALAANEAERDAIRQQYELNRQAATDRYRADLNALHNSQGWQGLFGDQFARDIRNNEQLMREWAESANQSLLMVRVAVTGTRDILQAGFATFATGLAANVSQAIIYSRSIGEAFRAATAAALQQIAAEAAVRAIYSAAIGFIRLAMGDVAGAAAAFKAAALFGAVSGAAMAGGRALAPRSESVGAVTGSSAGGQSSGRAADASGGSGGSGGTTVSVIVNGPVLGLSGVEQLAEIINEAVVGRDVRLIATQVKQGGQVVR